MRGTQKPPEACTEPTGGNPTTDRVERGLVKYSRAKEENQAHRRGRT